jgi:nitrate reductase gamma subunit
MKILLPLIAVAALFCLGLLGAVPRVGWIVGVGVPYLAAVLLLGGLVWRVMSWANVPVPFRIPVTCGQQKSLPWIRHQKLENPVNTLGVIGRMALEILCFRSLMRNVRARMLEQKRLVFSTDLSLWLGAMAMHWAFLVIVIRHLRFFTFHVPACVAFLDRADGFVDVGMPVFYLSTMVFILAVAYLIIRRIRIPQVRYISLATDYFPLLLMLGIGASGFCLRHVFRTDVAAIKQLALGLVRFAPVVPASISPLFFGHLMLVCVLAAYLPFSKLAHMAGVFLSPTRNLANNNRRVRHINPWDYPVKVHAYADYEDELREKMEAAGIPVEKH